MRPASCLSLLILCMVPALVHAADRPWWQFWGEAAGPAADGGSAARQSLDRRFTPEQRTLLRDFLRQRQRTDEGPGDDGRGRDKPKKAKPLPPGLRKKVARGGELPPGWQKKLARGEVVDDAVWARSSRLPPDLLRRLGPLPADTEVRYVEDRVYRVMRDSREIIDILGL